MAQSKEIFTYDIIHSAKLKLIMDQYHQSIYTGFY